MRLEPYEGIWGFTCLLTLTDHEHDRLRPHIQSIFLWGNDQYGPYGTGWAMQTGSDGFRVLFRTEADAMGFTLRWR